MQVDAAGAVLWRAAGEDFEVAVVHRPKYDDWSLPKGKLGAREEPLAAARREVAEETGQATLPGPELGEVRYPVRTRDGTPAEKVVRYWAMQATGGAFTATDEVDELRWLSPAAAQALLSYERDRAILQRFLATRGAPRRWPSR